MCADWDKLPVLEQMAITYSDMYKDAHGFRPRQDTSTWTEFDFGQEFEFLQAVIDRKMEDQRAAEEIAADRFEDRVVQMIALGAKDREAALRWIMEADEAGGDWDYLCFKNGLRYGYFQV